MWLRERFGRRARRDAGEGRTTNKRHARVYQGGGDSGQGRTQDWLADAKVRGLGEENEPADTMY